METTGTYMHYLKVIEIAGILSRDKEDGWSYKVEITGPDKGGMQCTIKMEKNWVICKNHEIRN